MAVHHFDIVFSNLLKCLLILLEEIMSSYLPLIQDKKDTLREKGVLLDSLKDSPTDDDVVSKPEKDFDKVSCCIKQGRRKQCDK